MELTEKQTERFWERVDKTDACWLWTGGKFANGYGSVHPSRRKQFHPNYKENIVLDHLCGIRHCVNPRHLNPTTIYLNSRREHQGLNRKPVLKIKSGQVVKRYESLSIAAQDVGRSAASICNCIKGKLKSSAGFQWRYV